MGIKNVAHRIRSRPKENRHGPSNFVSWMGRFMDRSRRLTPFCRQFARAFGVGSIIGRGNSEGTASRVETSGPEAELFALAEIVEFRREGFSQCAFTRNEAQIAYLRDPSIMTFQALEKSKTAEAVGLEILDIEIRRLANMRATTVIGLKLKASDASMDSKLADSIVGDLLRL